MHPFPERPGSLAMHDPHRLEVRHAGIIQILFKRRDRLIHRHAQEVDLRGHRSGLGHADPAGAGALQSRSADRHLVNQLQIFDIHLGMQDAHAHLQIPLLIRQRRHAALQIHGPDKDGIPDLQRLCIDAVPLFLQRRGAV